MAQEKQYRTVHGIVQFEPREGEAGGKPVRNITVRQAGFGPTAVRVSATLWPSHAHVKVEEGSVVTIEGPYTQNKSTGDDGETRTFHNLSVSRIFVHGMSDSGKKADVENAVADDVADDDIPF